MWDNFVSITVFVLIFNLYIQFIVPSIFSNFGLAASVVCSEPGPERPPVQTSPSRFRPLQSFICTFRFSRSSQRPALWLILFDLHVPLLYLCSLFLSISFIHHLVELYRNLKLCSKALKYARPQDKSVVDIYLDVICHTRAHCCLIEFADLIPLTLKSALCTNSRSFVLSSPALRTAFSWLESVAFKYATLSGCQLFNCSTFCIQWYLEFLSRNRTQLNCSGRVFISCFLCSSYAIDASILVVQ